MAEDSAEGGRGLYDVDIVCGHERTPAASRFETDQADPGSSPANILVATGIGRVIASSAERAALERAISTDRLTTYQRAAAAAGCDVLDLYQWDRDAAAAVLADIAILEAVGARIFGFVFNMIPRRQAKDYTGFIDAEKSIPLRVQVFGAGSAPALQIGFTRISSYDGYGYHEDPKPESVNLAPATIAVASGQLDSAVVEPASAGPNGVGAAQAGTPKAPGTPPQSRGPALWPGGLDT